MGGLQEGRLKVIVECLKILPGNGDHDVGWKRKCVLKCSVRRFVAKVLRSLIFHEEAFWWDVGVKKNKQGQNENLIVDCCWLIAFKYQSLCCSGDISRPKQSINQEWWKLIVAFNIAQNVFVAVPLLAPPPSHIHTQPWMCHSYIAVTWSFINMDTHAKPRSPLCTWHWMMSPKLWAWGLITTQMGSSTNPKSWLVCMTILIHITDSEATVAIW